MKIFDLTRGKYSNLYTCNENSRFEVYIHEMVRSCRNFTSVFTNNKISTVVSLLENIPVFLVESSMAGEYVAVPENNNMIQVPADSVSEYSIEDLNINTWLNEKEGKVKNNEASKIEIKELLGVYISDVEDKLIPRKIFIWMDKIKESEIFNLVFCHEMAHALMDVQMYGVAPEASFSYSNDYVYRFYEEALANAVALQVFDCVEGKISPLVEDFVKNQPENYAAGWDLYERRVYADQWMGIKVLFNYDIAFLIKESWDRYIRELPKCFKCVYNENWIAVKNRFEKFYLLSKKIFYKNKKFYF